ncbi:hypothetical protein FS749_009624 [Ceratobasidium sp. UAMH 11750]|nr:hypothetical protein FS749_009624 [Ceratobasidium sp. UAMH 11750]
MLRRRMGVRVGDCDVLPPGSVKLEEDAEDEIGEWPQGERPTRWTFIALRHRLAHITARVIEHFQDLAGGRHCYRVVQAGWRREIEGTARAEETGEAARSPTNGQPSELGEEPGVYPFLALHRFMVNNEIRHVRIALHRPYVLRMGEKYDPLEPPASTPPESTAVVETWLDGRLLGRITVHFATIRAVWIDYLSPYPISAQPDHIPTPFYSTRVLDIALLLSPAGPNAAELRSYLDDFIQIHASQSAKGVASRIDRPRAMPEPYTDTETDKDADAPSSPLSEDGTADEDDERKILALVSYRFAPTSDPDDLFDAHGRESLARRYGDLPGQFTTGAKDCIRICTALDWIFWEEGTGDVNITRGRGKETAQPGGADQNVDVSCITGNETAPIIPGTEKGVGLARPVDSPVAGYSGQLEFSPSTTVYAHRARDLRFKDSVRFLIDAGRPW